MVVPADVVVVIVEAVARMAHEANAAYCDVIGDNSQPAWKDAPTWQRESARDGVIAILEGRVAEPKDSHESWLEHKRAKGWRFGAEKDADARTHPCMVPFDQLPLEQRKKDILFFAVVTAGLRAFGLERR